MGSKFSGSGRARGFRFGIGFHKIVSKPVGLLVVGPKYALFIVIEHIRLSTKPAG